MSKVKNILAAVDGGTSAIKTFVGGRYQASVTLPHAIVEITPSQAEAYILNWRGNVPREYMVIDGHHFLVGDLALRHDPFLQNPIGVARYIQRDGNYMPYLFIASIVCAINGMKPDQSFKKSAMDTSTTGWRIRLATVMPPLDMSGYHRTTFRSNFGNKAEKKTFHVYFYTDGAMDEKGGDKKKQRVKEVHIQFDKVAIYSEPEGGFYCWMLNRVGTAIKSDALGRLSLPGHITVFDLGKRTLDGKNFVSDGRAFEPGNLHRSARVGIGDAMDTLSALLGDRFASELGGHPIDPTILDYALVHKKFQLSGTLHDVTGEVDHAMKDLMHEYRLTYEAMGGGVSSHTIILTGGGHILVEPYIQALLRHNSVQRATDTLPLNTANSAGLIAIMNYLRKQNQIDFTWEDD